MVDLIAKRYVKALVSGQDIEAVKSVYGELKTISTAFLDNKFVMIVGSNEIEVSKKVDLILSFVENCSNATTNLIKLLAEKKRLDIIPDIVSDLNNRIAQMTNTYEGIVYTNSALSDEDLTKLNNQFAKKLNVNLTLKQNVCDYDGIKVDIEGLGSEISFSKDRLRAQMIEHILKAV
jgi:F-type H+-transporting ATPase subunit delta